MTIIIISDQFIALYRLEIVLILYFRSMPFSIGTFASCIPRVMLVHVQRAVSASDYGPFGYSKQSLQQLAS